MRHFICNGEEIGTDNIVIQEYRLPATAPLTKNQKKDSLGGIVVGKGNGIYKVSTAIHPKVEIIRPNWRGEYYVHNRN